MRLNGFGVLLGVLRAHRQPGEGEPAQKRADAALGQGHPELPRDAGGQITAPPAHHAVARGVRAGAHPLGDLLRLLRCQAWPRPGRDAVRQPLHAFFVVAVYPVAQRLAIHPGRPRRRAARDPFQHQSERQKPPRHARITRPRRQRPQVRRAMIIASNRHRHHEAPPSTSSGK